MGKFVVNVFLIWVALSAGTGLLIEMGGFEKWREAEEGPIAIGAPILEGSWNAFKFTFGWVVDLASPIWEDALNDETENDMSQNMS